MFSGGIGAIDDQLTSKLPPTKDLLVAKIGGPVYRIGVGGGAASSVQVQGGEANRSDQLDFGAVQRGDAEMEQKVHRLIRSCIETGKDNPILSIHDQGAGGNGNVLKELVEAPSNVPNCGGAVINVNKFDLGDPTLSVQEVWGAEYQESNAALLNPERLAFVEAVSRRERCPLSIVGQVTGDNRVISLSLRGLAAL
uniref:PurM-like C-terminal domain-containing protein n=1 Tax=Plectus sambesii TaxID=2011161 RepID=A0A914VDV4_9BILA